MPPSKNPSDERGRPRRALGNLLSEARRSRGVLQKSLASRVHGLSHSTLSLFEGGKRRPSLPQLLYLADQLKIDPLEAFLVYAGEQLEVAPADFPEGAAGERFEQALGHLKARFSKLADAQMPLSRPPRGADGWSLQDFPRAFSDLVIVTGDKRESPKPKSLGDVGAYSASPIDDRWIHTLKLPAETEKVSDKEFIVSSEERLRRVYGRKNLLVLGSPASNHLARIVNRRAVFPFNTRSSFEQDLEALLDELRSQPSSQHSRFTIEIAVEKNIQKLKNWMQAFFAGGILDPLKGDVHGISGGPDRDYATITLAVHPWAEGEPGEHVCVLVGGFHHPGTASALRFLANPDHFEDRPFGGVIEVTLDTLIPWEDRMRNLDVNWETVPYTRTDLLAGLDRLTARRESQELTGLLNVEVDRLTDVRTMVKTWSGIT